MLVRYGEVCKIRRNRPRGVGAGRAGPITLPGRRRSISASVRRLESKLLCQPAGGQYLRPSEGSKCGFSAHAGCIRRRRTPPTKRVTSVRGARGTHYGGRKSVYGVRYKFEAVKRIGADLPQFAGPFLYALAPGSIFAEQGRSAGPPRSGLWLPRLARARGAHLRPDGGANVPRSPRRPPSSLDPRHGLLGSSRRI